MTNEQIRIKVAEARGLSCKSCGGTGIRRKMGPRAYHSMRNSEKVWRETWPIEEPDVPCSHDELPDYPNDLNACAEFEKTLTKRQRDIVADWLDDGNGGHFATAPQRCEAFLRCLGLWEEAVTGEKEEPQTPTPMTRPTTPTTLTPHQINALKEAERFAEWFHPITSDFIVVLRPEYTAETLWRKGYLDRRPSKQFTGYEYRVNTEHSAATP